MEKVLNKVEKITKLDIGIKTGKEHFQECWDEIEYLIDNDLEIGKIFGGRLDRLLTADMLSTIYDNEKSKLIGFANLVVEKQNHNFYFLDVGIIKEYRGKHVASYILEELKNISQFIIVETKQNNVLANKSLKNRTAFLFEKSDRNIYLLQKDRYHEFMDNGYYDKLTHHYNEPNNEVAMRAQLYKEEKGKVKIKTNKNNK